MTAEEIRKYDPEDVELKNLMGSRFQDLTHENPNSKPVQGEPVMMPIEENLAKEAEYEAFTPKKQPSFFDNLKASARSALTFGGLNFLIFYWEHIGLMDESIAVPCMCVCSALAGWGVGKNFAKECRR